jgi:dihydrofolate reductase
MKAIIAVNKLGYIGKEESLPWKCKEDLNHFKKMTMNCKLLVGRKTFEALPPLKGRNLIVVGKGYNTLEEALEQKPDWIIGGKKIYESTIHLCDELHISEINDETIGDTKIPEIKNFFGKKIFYKFDID